MNTLSGRVQQLVDQMHGGSVNAAAKSIGMKQQTLARVVSGAIENPRAKTLEQIARFYRVTLEWLLTGAGEGPAFRPYRIVIVFDAEAPSFDAARALAAAALRRSGRAGRTWTSPQPVADAIAGLPFVQQIAAQMLGTGHTVRSVVDALGVNRVQVHSWKEDAAFAATADAVRSWYESDLAARCRAYGFNALAFATVCADVVEDYRRGADTLRALARDHGEEIREAARQLRESSARSPGVQP